MGAPTSQHPRAAQPTSGVPSASKRPGRLCSWTQPLFYVDDASLAADQENPHNAATVACTALVCIVFLAVSLYWCWHLIAEQMHHPTKCGPIPLACTRDFWTVVTTRVSEGESTPVKSVLLAGVVVLLTLIAFYVHIVRGDTLLKRDTAARKRRELADAQDRELDLDGTPIALVVEDFPGERGYVQRLRRAFVTKRGLVVFWFGPAIAFFLVMVADGQTDAAVFAMALAAIYVAGEHYSTLEGQKAAAERQQTALETVSGQLKENVESIASALGKTHALQAMYKVYEQLKPDERPSEAARQSGVASKKRDRCIYAIYREFDIDGNWWESSWAEYCEGQGEEHQGLSLYRALIAGKRYSMVIVVPFSFRARARPRLNEKEARVREFKDLIGLMWFCVVLWHVRRDLPDLDPEANQSTVRPPGTTPAVAAPVEINHRIVMAETGLWVHVVDGEVHQILDQPGNELAVRNLSLNVGLRSVPLAEWAQREICDLAARGPSAQEYLCSRLCRAYPNLLLDVELNEAECVGVLDAIHMKAWLALYPEAKRTKRRDRCVELLRDFVQVLELQQSGVNRKRGEPRKDSVQLKGDYKGRARCMTFEVQ